MVKVKVLQQMPAPSTGRGANIERYQRNKDPLLHPLERSREYTRALNAVKLERIFAKPFLGTLDGHTDAVRCITKTKNGRGLRGSEGSTVFTRSEDAAEGRGPPVDSLAPIYQQ